MSADGAAAAHLASRLIEPKPAELQRPRPARDGRRLPLVARIERPKARWVIRGIASTPTIDDHGTSLNTMGCLIRRLPLPLLLGHEIPLGAGYTVESRFVGDELMDRARIGEIYSVEKCLERVVIEAAIESRWAMELICGGLRALSVGIDDMRTRRDSERDIDVIEEWGLREVSVLARGSNPDCVLEILRGADDF